MTQHNWFLIPIASKPARACPRAARPHQLRRAIRELPMVALALEVSALRTGAQGKRDEGLKTSVPTTPS